MTKKLDLYNEASRHGQEAAFVANVIMNHHSNPAKKLAGLVKLLQSGNRARTAQFSLDQLIINDRQVGWETLESPDVLKVWGIAQ